MKKFVIAAFFLVVLVFWFQSLRPFTPFSKGKPFSFWLSDLGSIDGEKRANAEQTIQAMGTSAIPSLLYALDQPRISFRSKLEHDSEVIRAFSVLGTNAVPTLEKLLQDGCYPKVVVHALARMPEGRDIFLNTLSSTKIINVRRTAASGLARTHQDPNCMNKQLVDATTDSDPVVRYYSLVTLGNIENPKWVIPLLVEKLQDADIQVQQAAIEGLGKQGNNAVVALPALSNALTHPQLWQIASNSIRLISSE